MDTQPERCCRSLTEVSKRQGAWEPRAWRVGCDVLVGSIWQALMASLQAMAVRSLVLAAVAAAVLLLRR